MIAVLRKRMVAMKYLLLYLVLLIASISLALLSASRGGTLKYVVLAINVLIGSVIIGLMMASVISIR